MRPRRRPSGRALRDALLVAVISGCDERGVVGIVTTQASHPAPSSSAPRDGGNLPGPDASGVISVDDCLPQNPAGLDPGVAEQLASTSGDPTGMRFLYPYDGTVYPQGIPGPLFMWDGPASSAVDLRVHSSKLDYRGCFALTEQGRFALPSGIWDLVTTSTNGAEDPYTVELKVLSGEAVYGPISVQLVVARGALTGYVYYMTSASPALVAGVMRVPLGGVAEAYLTPPSCAGCHSVSAQGNRLVAVSSAVGSSFSVSTAAAPAPLGSAPGAEFPGLSPDGSLYVASAHPAAGPAPRSYGTGLAEAGLYETATGTPVTGSGIPGSAGMPAFSPDGTQLTFTDLGEARGHAIAGMRFSIASRAASDLRTLYTTPTQYVGWPSFLPDGRAVLFAQGDSTDFSAQGAGLMPVIRGAASDLYLVDAGTGAATPLLRANGFDTAADLDAGRTYLPAGAVDLHQNYYPSVGPQVAGGYAWVFFDSLRAYGNQGTHRSVWATAIALSDEGSYAADPSHPAFFLPGQILGSGNFRPMAAPVP